MVRSRIYKSALIGLVLSAFNGCSSEGIPVHDRRAPQIRQEAEVLYGQLADTNHTLIHECGGNCSPTLSKPQDLRKETFGLHGYDLAVDVYSLLGLIPRSSAPASLYS